MGVGSHEPIRFIDTCLTINDKINLFKVRWLSNVTSVNILVGEFTKDKSTYYTMNGVNLVTLSAYFKRKQRRRGSAGNGLDCDAFRGRAVLRVGAGYRCWI